MGADFTTLSKTAAHALRHEPWLYGLELDGDGWVEVRDLVAALRAARKQWSGVDAATIAAMVAASPKNRYELDGDRIRARYGHSTSERIVYPASVPPETLFHGTAPEVVAQILREGLTPRSRQYVHLAVDPRAAREVGSRKARTPTLLAVRAREAHEQGILFYRGNELVWLADRVPAQFIVTT
jgi:putative RNA 2'-phosphotransferase